MITCLQEGKFKTEHKKGMLLYSCKKGHRVIKFAGEGYEKGRHQEFLFGWYCKKCEEFIINPSVALSYVSVFDLTKKITNVMTNGEPILTKEDIQRARGMIN